MDPSVTNNGAGRLLVIATVFPSFLLVITNLSTIPICSIVYSLVESCTYNLDSLSCYQLVVLVALRDRALRAPVCFG